MSCACGRPVPASSRDGVHCAEHDLPATGPRPVIDVPSHHSWAWQQALATPAYWCPSCGEYRVEKANQLCPVCQPQPERRAS